MTLSGLGHAAACPGSAALPRVGRLGGSEFGSATHEMLSERIDGAPWSDDTAPIAERWQLDADDAGRLAFLARVFRPDVPAGALAEVPLGLFEDGSVRRVEGARGSYEDLPGLILAGTIDVMWSEPQPIAFDRHGSSFDPDEPLLQDGSTLWLADWKAGEDRYVAPIARNWQLRGAALLAARWTGAARVIPALCFVDPGEASEVLRAGKLYSGRWEVGAPLGAVELDAIEREVREVIARAKGESDVRDHGEGVRAAGEGLGRRGDGGGGGGEREAAILPDAREPAPDGRSDRGAGQAAEIRGGLRGLSPGAAGLRPHLITGPHCEHCDSRAFCPAQLTEVRALVAPAEVSDQLALTDEQASHLAGLLPRAESVTRNLRAALEAHVEARGPIAMANGKVWGPVVETRERLDVRKTYEALAAEIGEEGADRAFKTGKGAVGDAIARAHAGAGIKRQVAPTVGRVLGAVREAGGIERIEHIEHRAYWPEGAASAVPALPEAPAQEEVRGLDVAASDGGESDGDASDNRASGRGRGGWRSDAGRERGAPAPDPLPDPGGPGGAVSASAHYGRGGDDLDRASAPGLSAVPDVLAAAADPHVAALATTEARAPFPWERHTRGPLPKCGCGVSGCDDRSPLVGTRHTSTMGIAPPLGGGRTDTRGPMLAGGERR